MQFLGTMTWLLAGVVGSLSLTEINGDRKVAVIGVAIALGLAAIAYQLPTYGWSSRGSHGNCYTEWDGRNNPTVCD